MNVLPSPLIMPNGITIKKLRSWLDHFPDQDDNGDDTTVWLAGRDGLSNEAVEAWSLGDGSIIIETRRDNDNA